MPYDVSVFELPGGSRAIKAIGIGVISKEDADLLMKRVEQGGDLHRLPMLVLAQRMEKMSPEARSLFSARTTGAVVRIWCAVVGSNPLIRVTVNFLLRISRSTTTKMFSGEAEAIAWLDARVREDAGKEVAAP
jgi:hypothetical protein